MPFRRSGIVGILTGCLVLTAGFYAAVNHFGSWAALRGYIGGHSVHVFPSAVELGERKAGTEVSVSFFVRNLTSSELSIVGQRASCLCVVGTKLPLAIEPRQTTRIDVVVRLHEAQQRYEETVVLMLSEPNRLTFHPVRITAVVLDAPSETPTEEGSVRDASSKCSFYMAALAHVMFHRAPYERQGAQQATTLALETRCFAPKGLQHISPGQSVTPPRVAVTISSPALKGRHKRIQAFFRPFRAFSPLMDTQPGASATLAWLASPCPGLICGALSGQIFTPRAWYSIAQGRRAAAHPG